MWINVIIYREKSAQTEVFLWKTVNYLRGAPVTVDIAVKDAWEEAE